MHSRISLYLNLQLIMSIILIILSVFLQNSIVGQKLIPFFVVIAFFWSVFSLYKNGFSLFHPYFIFLYCVFGYIVWNIFFNFIGAKSWEDLWLADQFLADKSVLYKTNLLVLYFILFSNIGALIFIYKNQNNSFESRIPNISESQLLEYRFFAKKFYFYSLPFVFLYVFNYVLAVYQHGYLILYDPDKFYKLPVWLSLADDITRVFFWTFIVTKPTLTESKKVIITYLFITFLFLGMGTRGIVFSEFLAIGAAIVYLGYKFSLKKFALVGLSILLLSPIIEKLRVNDYELQNSLLTSVIGSQGLPLLSVSAAISFENELPTDSYKYIYGPISEFLNSSPINTINDLPRLPQVLSFLLDEDSFNLGWGMGNTIISEFYIFGGVLGLCVLSLLYTYFLLKLFISYQSLILMFSSFISMRIIFFTVRENPAYIIVQLIYPLIIFCIFVVFMKYKSLKIK